MRGSGALSPTVGCMTLEVFLNLCELSFPHGQMGAVVSALKDSSKDEMKARVESAQFCSWWYKCYVLSPCSCSHPQGLCWGLSLHSHMASLQETCGIGSHFPV